MSAKIQSIEARPVYLTPKEVRERFKIHAETLRRWNAKGLLKPVVLGKLWRYKLSEVERLERAGTR